MIYDQTLFDIMVIIVTIFLDIPLVKMVLEFCLAIYEHLITVLCEINQDIPTNFERQSSMNQLRYCPAFCMNVNFVSLFKQTPLSDVIL